MGSLPKGWRDEVRRSIEIARSNRDVCVKVYQQGSGTITSMNKRLEMEALIDNHCLERLTCNLITAGRSLTKKEGLLDLELERGNLADIELAATELLSIESFLVKLNICRGLSHLYLVIPRANQSLDSRINDGRDGEIEQERLRISKKDITYVLGILLDLLTDPSKIGGEYQPSHKRTTLSLVGRFGSLNKVGKYLNRRAFLVRHLFRKRSFFRSSPLQEDLLAYQFETKLGSFFPGKKGLLPLSRTCTTHSVFLRSGSATALYDFLARSSHKLSAYRSNNSRTQWYRRKRVTIKKEIVQHNSHSYKRGQWLQMSEGQVASVAARKLEPVSGDGQGAQRATSTAKAAVAVVEARNRLKAFPSVEGPYFTYVSHSREKMILSMKSRWGKAGHPCQSSSSGLCSLPGAEQAFRTYVHCFKVSFSMVMVAAENDCQSGNNKSQIGSGRASPTLSSLRIQASVKLSFTLLGNEIQDTIGKQKTFLARHFVIRMLEFRGGYISVGSVGSSERQDPSKSGIHFDTFPRVTRFFTLSHALSTKTTGPSCKSRKIHSLSLLQGQEMGMNARLFDSSSI
ncbi:hypothetical protein V6N12_013729 [Hibiscus sabdariffa]|uniref:Uncharacterized protein n=1 Tax=Hibiscus sabdariffa TaxID=183260 RepID=A0ABR2CV47_9ROSI